MEINSIDKIGAIKEIYGLTLEEMKRKIKSEEEIVLNENVFLIDIRPSEEFADFRLPGAKNFDSFDDLNEVKKLIEEIKNKKVFVICRRGIGSQKITFFLKSREVETYSIEGGMYGWRDENFPHLTK
ncbi:rhodanese-like domain-containing protein [Candidatus Pacearchaeota archaeon]|nr:rhodanese-like domain-containing protein [Candidatus Pacearchaeota archaeon]